MNLKTDACSIFMTFCKVLYKRSYQLLLSQTTLHIAQLAKRKSKIQFLLKLCNMRLKNNAYTVFMALLKVLYQRSHQLHQLYIVLCSRHPVYYISIGLIQQHETEIRDTLYFKQLIEIALRKKLSIASFVEHPIHSSAEQTQHQTPLLI